MDVRQGFQYLGHSTWAICSPLSQFCSPNFPTFSLSSWRANSYYPREGKAENGKGEFSQHEWIGCLGHSSWTMCSPLSQFCSPNFPTFSLSCREANSYYPRGLILRKGNSPNFRNGRHRGVWVPGAFKLDHLQPLEPILIPTFFNFFTFMLGGQFLFPKRGEG